ncbi:hypothetical protein PHJA_001771800 [Phtheirospermum japonicum]|uniref:C2 domain-containing protein n=1 Tax=Phtheirospermum japonicum TaxID=374723 RepID=A0A830C6D9_9LAMI|nr:hypothetical protein PHJA_001771800 [Phtheirospermum japonicum]
MAQFIYNPNANQESEDTFSGILEIHVHHARNIHNICIYDNQDVYAKFSLTYDPDGTLSTRIINGGGKNPDFNEDLIMKIHQADAVLKCEIWMLSRAKNYMDDQLLGFALVPISSVSGKGKVTQDFDLSSTDLFHSPAGTIKLSLSLSAKTPLNVSFSESVVDSCSATSELLMDKKIPDDYCRIEFPDINDANENQQMVSEYFARNGQALLRPWLEKPDGSFLHLGARPVEDCEMGVNSSYSVSPDGSIQNSGFQSSTMTSLSDDRNSADSMEKKVRFFADFSTSPDETPTSKKKSEPREESEPNFPGNDEENKMSSTNAVGLVRNVKLEAEESVMQKQIVDMYMKSMQQFTESLAKMKLPMGLDKPEIDNQGDLIQNADEKIEIEKKDNSRVFYGSRAFF